jgi:drug/metabolite transporter (DMT)-like permease
MGAKEWALLLFLSLVWGGSFFFGKVAVAEVGPLTIAFVRVAVAAVALRFVAGLLGESVPSSLKAWGAFLAMGLLNNAIPFSLIFWGQTRIPIGLASILNATTPLFTLLVAHALTADEKLTWNRFVGVLLGLLGVVSIVGSSVLGGAAGDGLGEVAVLGAALSYACASVYGRRFRGESPLATATGQLSGSAIILLPLAAVIDRPWMHETPRAETVAALSGLALLSTALAYVVYFRLLGVVGATNVVLVTLLVPISALLLGLLVLGESIEPREIAGMAAIALGLVVIDGRGVGWVRGRLPPPPHSPASSRPT